MILLHSHQAILVLKLDVGLFVKSEIYYVKKEKWQFIMVKINFNMVIV